ncbi:MAG: type I restriction enzyme HsdR N-terminal domain-containing protein [Thermodesulfovibrionales bacterium]
MGHKRILGKTIDFITGREITDTDDERYRQKLAHILIEEKGYTKGDVEVKRRIETTVDSNKVLSMVDFVVTVDETAFMVIRYGPGSIVTRERPALAAARILAQYQIPCTIVTNGEDAEILDTLTGKVVGTGIASIPDKSAARQQLSKIKLQHLSPEQSDTEKRILSAYDWLEHSLECDDDWCAEE